MACQAHSQTCSQPEWQTAGQRTRECVAASPISALLSRWVGLAENVRSASIYKYVLSTALALYIYCNCSLFCSTSAANAAAGSRRAAPARRRRLGHVLCAAYSSSILNFSTRYFRKRRPTFFLRGPLSGEPAPSASAAGAIESISRWGAGAAAERRQLLALQNFRQRGGLYYTV